MPRGSASTDGGAGVLTGLGARLLAHSVATVASSTDGELAGTLVPDGGEGLARVVGLDLGDCTRGPARCGGGWPST